jgi:predicted nucleic acid-binding Zn ribbon protein
MYEVSQNYYTGFHPEVVQAAAARSAALKEECNRRVPKTLTPAEYIWMKGSARRKRRN